MYVHTAWFSFLHHAPPHLTSSYATQGCIQEVAQWGGMSLVWCPGAKLNNVALTPPSIWCPWSFLPRAPACIWTAPLISYWFYLSICFLVPLLFFHLPALFSSPILFGVPLVTPGGPGSQCPPRYAGVLHVPLHKPTCVSINPSSSMDIN